MTKRIRSQLAGPALVVAVWLTGAGAETWQTNLKTGGVVRVDPQTHKPTLYFRGGSAPLWDGVHELEDGSVLTVRDGVAVPDETMLRTWRSEPVRQALEEDASCRQLVRRACGLGQECAARRACLLARQLQQLAEDEAAQAGNGLVPGSLQECRRGLADAGLFPDCGEDTATTPCGRLVERVCGGDDRCAAAAPCDAARQLRGLEREERLARGETAQGLTESARQCREAMQNAYFVACPGP
jgi:hypothetical protein